VPLILHPGWQTFPHPQSVPGQHSRSFVAVFRTHDCPDDAQTAALGEMAARATIENTTRNPRIRTRANRFEIMNSSISCRSAGGQTQFDFS
jgi:hypothetical protein